MNFSNSYELSEDYFGLVNNLDYLFEEDILCFL